MYSVPEKTHITVRTLCVGGSAMPTELGQTIQEQGQLISTYRYLRYGVRNITLFALHDVMMSKDSEYYLI
jgi:hypothetical protein